MTIPVGREMLASQLAATNSTKIDQFPANIGTHGMLMIFNEYVFERPGSRSLLRLPRQTVSTITQSKGAILLPIPNILQDRDSIRISQSDLVNTLFGETAATLPEGARALVDAVQSQGMMGAAWNGIAGAATSIGTSASNAYTSIMNNGVSSPVSTADALFLAKKLFGDNYLLGPLSQGFGATLNPRASLLFEKVELKEYSFQWTLAPTEQAESDLIRNIVRRLKQNALPTYNAETIATRVLFNYPSTVDIYLLGVDPSHFVRFKTAMIESVLTNYTPNGLSLLKGGKPAAVELSINLKEMDIHTADEIFANEVLDVLGSTQ